MTRGRKWVEQNSRLWGVPACALRLFVFQNSFHVLKQWTEFLKLSDSRFSSWFLTSQIAYDTVLDLTVCVRYRFLTWQLVYDTAFDWISRVLIKTLTVVQANMKNIISTRYLLWDFWKWFNKKAENLLFRILASMLIIFCQFCFYSLLYIVLFLIFFIYNSIFKKLTALF